jgi:hypothetical protein
MIQTLRTAQAKIEDIAGMVGTSDHQITATSETAAPSGQSLSSFQ